MDNFIRFKDLYFESRQIRRQKLTAQTVSEYSQELSKLLNTFKGGSRFLLPFVSRIKRNLILGMKPLPDLSQERISRRVPKFVVITAVWKREKLTKIFYDYYLKLKYQLENTCEINLLVIGSEGIASASAVDRFGGRYIEAPNSPLNEKWQAGVEVLRKQSFDAVIIVGSDDFLSPSVFKSYAELYKQGANVVGFIDGHFFNTSTNEMLFWGGYGGPKRDLGMPERVGESIGMGRLLSREVLELLDYNVWTGEPINKGL
ncbi:hypothetical protein, partial [Idiomarina sp. UBA3162]